MPTYDKRPSGRIVRFNIDDPEDLIAATKSGLVWLAPKYAQRGVDAIQSGKVALADCKKMPANIRALLS